MIQDPKQTAQHLFESFLPLMRSDSPHINAEQAKLCADMAASEVQWQVSSYRDLAQQRIDDDVEYWKRVREEIYGL